MSQSRRLAAIMFTDIVGYSALAQQDEAKALEMLGTYREVLRSAFSRHRGREVKTIGDGFLATFDATARALRCAAEILAGAKGLGLELRAGIHTGEIEVRGDDIAGLAVTMAKRICDLADLNEILVSRTVVDLTAGSGLQFEPRREHQLKGVPGTWPTFAALPST